MSDPTTSYNNSSNSGRNQPAVLRGGGRTPGAGRHLYSPNNNANNNNKQQQPMDVHSGSGLPHGHVPAYLPGSASLVEELDQELLMILRDGRHVVGTLISFDPFSNLVVRDAVERRMATTTHTTAPLQQQQSYYYADIPLGLYIVRGENIVLLGRTTVNKSGGSAVSLQELEDLVASKQCEMISTADWDVDADLIA